MRGRAVARRYAWALVASVKDREYQEVNFQLEVFLKAFMETPLGEFLSSPFIPPSRKKTLVEEITPDFQKKVRNFLGLLAERNRMALFPLILDFFHQFWNSAHNIHQFTLISAVPPPEALVDRVRKALLKRFKGEVKIKTLVDPSIIGGLILKKGYTVYDGSIEKQLELIKRKIIEGE